MSDNQSDSSSKKSYRMGLGDIIRFTLLGFALGGFLIAYQIGPAERSAAFLAAGIGFGFWAIWAFFYWVDALEMRGWNHA